MKQSKKEGLKDYWLVQQKKMQAAGSLEALIIRRRRSICYGTKASLHSLNGVLVPRTYRGKQGNEYGKN